MIQLYNTIYFILGIIVAMLGYTIHGSIFWSILVFFFPLFAIAKWLICHEITYSIIHQTFAFLG